MKDSKNKYYSIDILKFIMALVVIAIHTKLLYYFDNKNITKIHMILIEYAVPFFFLSSGFLLGLKLELPSNTQKNWQ